MGALCVTEMPKVNGRSFIFYTTYFVVYTCSTWSHFMVRSHNFTASVGGPAIAERPSFRTDETAQRHP